MNKELFDRFVNGEIIINTQTKQEFLDLIKYLDSNVEIKLASSSPLFSIKMAYEYHAGNTCLQVEDGEHLFYDSKAYYIANEPELEIVNYSDLLSSKMTVDELRDLLLENFVDEWGDLDITGLDFSKFNGNVHISKMIVKRNLFQSNHSIGRNLYQGKHKVAMNIYQSYQEVDGDLSQGHQEVKLDYYCTNINYGGECCFDEPQKTIQEITKEELAEMGYKLKEETK